MRAGVHMQKVEPLREGARQRGLAGGRAAIHGDDEEGFELRNGHGGTIH